jgi:hypothetical protein
MAASLSEFRVPQRLPARPGFTSRNPGTAGDANGWVGATPDPPVRRAAARPEAAAARGGS